MGLDKIGKKLIRAGLIGSLLLGCSDSKNTTGPSPQPPSQPTQNRSPIVSSQCPISVEENHILNYQIEARDPEGRALQYSKLNGADWIFVSPTGLVSGIVPEVLADQGFQFEIGVSDGVNSVPQNCNPYIRNLFNIHDLPSTTTGVTDTSVSFSQPINYNIGDIVSSGITATTPSGLFREVTSISSDRRTIATRNASLENVVRDASLSYTQQLSPSGVRSFTSLNGVSPLLPSQSSGFNLFQSPASTQNLKFNISLNNVVLYDQDQSTTTTNDQIILNGTIGFDAGFDFDLNISGFSLNRVSFTQTLSNSADLTIGSNRLMLASLQEVKIAEYTFNPIVMGILPTFPPIPIIIVPQIGVYAGINPSRVNPLSFRVKQDASLTANVSYNGTWDASANFSNNFDFSIFNPTGEWDFTAFAGPRLKLPLFRVAGPFAAASAKLRLQSNAQGAEQLFGGLEASLGISVDILSRRIAAYSKKVISYDTLLAERATTPEQRIAYVTALSDSRAVIATINPDGTGRQTLTTTSSLANYPVWSPDRREIAYSKWIESGRMDIFVLGNNPRQLTLTGVNAPGSWSPDGTRMVISSFRNNNNDIYIINSTDGFGLTRLTTHSAEDVNPVWASDNWIYFISRRDGNREVYRMHPDGSSTTRITNNNSDEDNPSISPDGTKLLVNSNYDGDNEIYMIDLINGTAAQLTNNSAQDYQPSFSPDGTRIVFVSERSGRGAQLYTMNADGSNQTKITNEYLDDRPRWD